MPDRLNVRGAIVDAPKPGFQFSTASVCKVIRFITRFGYTGYRCCSFESAFVDERNEVFVTSTTRDVFPIRPLDNRAMDEGKPGPVTGRLEQACRAGGRNPGQRKLNR